MTDGRADPHGLLTAVDSMIFTTPRLGIRKARPSERDVDLLYRLWTSPEVMKFVGFPHGLRITAEEVKTQLAGQADSEYDVRLLVELNRTGQCIGECKLGRPDRDGVSETDVKLFPEFWGQGYGTEIKRGLVAYLFGNTDCKCIQATPNRANIASQKMQEAVGARRIGEGVFHFPANMTEYTVDVPYYRYRVYREDWEKHIAIRDSGV